ncbi:MAG: hypothetical protein NTY77_08975 [Elusimicrobia bacterium]|nr:hypothetical protein [Elusimicrobiota bacterium]
MTNKKGFECRFVEPDDAFDLMRLYQGSVPRIKSDAMFLDLARLRALIETQGKNWAVAAAKGQLVALVALQVDAENRLGRVRRMYAAGPETERREALSAALSFLMEKIAADGATDMVYSTTRTLTLEQQDIALEQGFKVLGVFPNAVYADPRRLNGLSAWFAPDVLTQRRHADFSLHPLVEPFFEIVRKQCELPKQGTAKVPAPPPDLEPCPPLEMIEAPRFVAERYRQVKARKNLSVNFFPFETPNILFTSPDGRVEVFVRLVKETRFACILAEHLTASVDAVRLYREVAQMLYDRRVIYIEVINDAADVSGTECILRAGFVPCGYMPCLKQTGDKRRDYVVFARSYEYFTYPKLKVNSLYLDYLREYCKARAAMSARDA